MTMQVAMVATDGILLASDTKWSENTIVDGEVRGSYTASKIWIDPTGRIAVTGARDMAMSIRIADGIFTLAGENGEARNRRIREIGAACANKHDAECLIAFADPTPSLYHFLYANSGVDVIVNRLPQYKHAGDINNPAVFLTQRYYKPAPISILMRLGALVIVLANSFNNAMIEGLEMVYCDASGFHRVTEDDIDGWKSTVADLDKGISSSILNGESK